MFQLVLLALLFPAAGIAANLLAGRRWRQPAPGIIATAAAGLAFAVAVLMFLALLGRPGGAVVPVAEWIHIGALEVDWALRVDTLSVTMMLVVTGVGAVIHLFAVAYMRGDPAYARFFIYLNLFLFSMLLLVTADNYVALFAGWELVGLCSYLLIGFWFETSRNATAGRKAFVVNRIGDLGFLLAMILIFWNFNTLTFDGVFAQAARLVAPDAVATAVTLLFLLAAAGKSAQLPLAVWLPDAMAGPTPVSALIHAATMVTAGIYLMARSHVLLAVAPASQLAVILIGSVTALWAAASALGQFDIKRVLAYSTISQLGFMVAAAGLGAYTAALFHLVTHAFFKALLFLAAGAITHALEVAAGPYSPAIGHGAPSPLNLLDMRQMGGLRRRMPLTFTAFLIGALALAGLPPLAGFFSKDEILAGFFAGYAPAYILLSVAAFLTAVYAARQVLLVFFGAPRTVAAANAGEGRPGLVGPLLALAGLSVVGGALNLPGVQSLAHWLGHTLREAHAAHFIPLVAGLATCLTLLGFGLAYLAYGRAPLQAGQPDPAARFLGPLFQAFHQAWWLDAAYSRLIVRPYVRLSEVLAAADLSVLLRLDRAAIRGTQALADLLRRTQTGQVNWNAAGIVGALLIVLLVLAWGGSR